MENSVNFGTSSFFGWDETVYVTADDPQTVALQTTTGLSQNHKTAIIAIDVQSRNRCYFCFSFNHVGLLGGFRLQSSRQLKTGCG